MFLLFRPTASFCFVVDFIQHDNIFFTGSLRQTNRKKLVVVQRRTSAFGEFDALLSCLVNNIGWKSHDRALLGWDDLPVKSNHYYINIICEKYNIYKYFFLLFSNSKLLALLMNC